MHIAQQIIWRKKLEEHDENPNYTYFRKQFDEMIPLDVYYGLITYRSSVSYANFTPFVAISIFIKWE